MKKNDYFNYIARSNNISEVLGSIEYLMDNRIIDYKEVKTCLDQNPFKQKLLKQCEKIKISLTEILGEKKDSQDPEVIQPEGPIGVEIERENKREKVVDCFLSLARKEAVSPIILKSNNPWKWDWPGAEGGSLSPAPAPSREMNPPQAVAWPGAGQQSLLQVPAHQRPLTVMLYPVYVSDRRGVGYTQMVIGYSSY